MLEPSAQETLIRDFVRQLARKYGRDYWLAKAREGAFAEGMARRRESGGAAGTTPEEGFASYDKATLVKYGVTGWRGPKCQRSCTPEERAALDAKTMDWAARVVFDAPIGSHQGLQHPLAVAKTNLELAALMTRYAAQLFDAGDKVTAAAHANMAKLAAADAATEACDLAIEVHGGSGFSTDVDLITVWPFIRMLRTVPVSREMVLNYIGEHVLGLPRSY